MHRVTARNDMQYVLCTYDLTPKGQMARCWRVSLVPEAPNASQTLLQPSTVRVSCFTMAALQRQRVVASAGCRMALVVRAGEMVSTAYLVSVESLVVSSGARHLLANLAVALRSARSLSSVHRQTTFAQSLSHLGLANCRDSTWL